MRGAFRVARARYKSLEGVAEFYAPAIASAFNARRQEVDDDDAPPPATLAASGFPALEGLLWPRLATADLDSARGIVERMRPLARRLAGMTAGLAPTEAQVIEIARLELARVSTLGIAGFDAPRTGDGIRESAAAIDGVRRLFAVAGAGFWPRFGSRFIRAMPSSRARMRLRGHRQPRRRWWRSGSACSQSQRCRAPGPGVAHRATIPHTRSLTD